MKLLTLNCHSWLEENQLDKIKILAQTIKEQEYDVIALQEVNQSIAAEHVNGIIKKDNFMLVLLDYLKKENILNYEYTWDFSHIGFDIYEEGLGILTKHPIIEKYSFFITKTVDPNYWKTRKIIGTKIKYNNKHITFYSCHLGWWGEEEEPGKQQIDTLCDEALQDELIFLMGDFNNDANKRNEGYDYLLSKGLYDTYQLSKVKDSGITVAGKIAGWDNNKAGIRIDYIFSNHKVEVNHSTVIFNGTNKPVISDHFGLEVEIDLKL
ncbi:endonuclease/exonuclease/phosphatase family protein [Niallia sp. NCCP-28]|uniref:endonuclease/exonuclease/phosphatase family protein n=1 Tax=Niallia sp. NCCP-28 TaxID=2934712 RepID=UPI00207DA171|nr:endonuclease/exonuclease/phosphatase family protein [Niallia sp. NCCP-28]GKU83603.1 exodeoxyribonuclease III [Niallia sp. NCCP-28]